MYVAVIGCSLVITVIGVSALLAARIERRAAEGVADLSDARVYAQSAIDLGMYTILSDANWRTNKSSGTWKSNQSIGNGTYSLGVIDPIDGIFSNSKSEPVKLTGTGILRGAKYILEATATARPVALKALNTCLHSGGSATVGLLKSIIVTGAPLSMNGTFNGPGAVTGNVEAGSQGVLAIVSGTTTIPAAAKALPDVGVIDIYIGLATPIDYPGVIDKQLLTPGVNPWGVPNPDGVYFIDAGPNDLKIKASRIHGTLIVRCTGGMKVILDDDVFIQNYRSDYPALIVDGALDFMLNSASYGLRESAQTMNFNPVGSPYLGVTDSDMLDTYPNEVQGLVHVKGTLTMTLTSRVRGVIISEGNVTLNGTNEIVHQPTLYSNPPMGYVTYTMQIASGSWRRVVLP